MLHHKVSLCLCCIIKYQTWLRIFTHIPAFFKFYYMTSMWIWKIIKIQNSSELKAKWTLFSVQCCYEVCITNKWISFISPTITNQVNKCYEEERNDINGKAKQHQLLRLLSLKKTNQTKTLRVMIRAPNYDASFLLAKCLWSYTHNFGRKFTNL